MINSFYLNEDITKQINNTLDKEGIVRLDDFFEGKSYNSIFRDVSKLKFIKSDFPNKFSYSYSKIPKNILQLFFDDSFLSFIEKISGRKLSIDLSLRKFEHRNYTLLHDELKKDKGLIFMLFFTDNWKDEFGGMKIFELKKEKIIVSPKQNSFFLVNLKQETRSFVKYVNNLAKKNFYYVIEGNLKKQ